MHREQKLQHRCVVPPVKLQTLISLNGVAEEIILLLHITSNNRQYSFNPRDARYIRVMSNAYALPQLQHAQRIQAMKRVLKAFLDKLVIGIMYDEGCNSLILNNRLCFSFQAIPNMELRTRAANSWKGYRNKFYAEFVHKWTLQGPESPEVQTILMSLSQEFKGPKWDAKVNKLISLSTQKRIRLMAEGKHEEAETLKNALRKTVAQVTDYGLGDGNVGFESTPTTQAPQPKESKTEGQTSEEFSAYMKESTLRMYCGLGDGGVGFESTTIMQAP